MTSKEIYKEKMDWFIKGLDQYSEGVFITITIEEYFNFFEFAIKTLHTKPTMKYYRKDENFNLIEESIRNHDAYMILNFNSLVRHDIGSGDLNACQLEPIILLLKKTVLTTDENEKLKENPVTILKFLNEGIVYEASLLLKTKPKKTGYDIDVFLPENLIATEDLTSLKNKSILPFTILPNEQIPSFISAASYFINDENNELTTVNCQKLIDNNFKDDRLKVFYNNLYNNSILLHADKKGGGYLHESYSRGSIWHNLTEGILLFQDLKYESYSY